MILDNPRNAAASLPMEDMLHMQLFTSQFLSAEDRQALTGIATGPRPLKANVDLISEQMASDHVYLLSQGWACRYKTTRNGARQITGLIVSGDICNLDSLMRPKVNFGVRTLTAATVIGLPRTRLKALAAERPGVAHAFTWFAIAENAILSEWTLSCGRRLARVRLAHLLCEMCARLGLGHATTASFELPITQEQIADTLGLTGVHVNRTMKRLRDEGLIIIEGRQVTVPNVAELCRAGEFDGTYLHADHG
jgi:CRP-like cAMP-binding protein